MKFYLKPIIVAVLFCFVFIAIPFDLTQAQGTGFVTCSGVDCSACNLVQMANIIIKWLFGVIFLIFAVLMLVAGFGLVTSAGNQSALEAAKSKFKNGIIGLLIVMSAWIMVDTIMKGLLTGGTGNVSGYGPWSEVKCQIQTVVTEGGGTLEAGGASGTPPNPSVVAACTDDAALIAKYKGSPIGVEAPGLRTMINCYLADPVVNSQTDKSQLYTVDRSHPRCSLTNGNPVCGKCSHSNNSKHYGRGSGLGAQAVDFNAIGGSMAAETSLNNALKARRAVCGGTLGFETQPGAIHTHISL
jgi:hypothetical protein